MQKSYSKKSILKNNQGFSILLSIGLVLFITILTLLILSYLNGSNADNQDINTSASTSTEQTKSVSSNYGIAAGGGLPFLGQDDLNKYFDKLRALGVKWVRWDIEWGLVQPNNSDTYDWSAIDKVVNTAKRYEIDSLGIIDGAPEWARDTECKLKWNCHPADPNTFGTFSGLVAERYKDTISYFEIWNEPNIGWGSPADSGQYAQVLKSAYSQIKKSNSDAVVIGGALAPAADENGDIAPMTFVKSLYESGNNQYFDAISIHPSVYPTQITYNASWNTWQQMTQIRQYMVDNGDSDKNIWVSEFGSPTGGAGKAFKANQNDNFAYGSDYMTEQAQSELLVSALDSFSQNRDWIEYFFYYSLIDNGNTMSDTEDYFGLLRYDGSKKPSYDVFKTAINQN